MIRNEIERRGSEEELSHLRSALEEAATGVQDEVSWSVESGLRMQITDIEEQIAEYDHLRDGRISTLGGDSLDDLGEMMIKARIARGWSQADLARALDMEPQQVQRYERNDWQKISLWRLQEVAEVLGLRVLMRAQLDSHGRTDAAPQRWQNLGYSFGIPRLSPADDVAAVGSYLAAPLIGAASANPYRTPITTPLGVFAQKPQPLAGYRTDKSEGISYAPAEPEGNAIKSRWLLAGSSHG
jgi:transcriptional regulator with XRE-family HTH domain